MSVFARPTEPVANRLLAALPRDEYERLLPSLQQVSFSLGEVVYEFAGKLDYVFFPTTSIVSLLYTMENGSSAEMGLTGNDGVVGIALFMGGGTMPIWIGLGAKMGNPIAGVVGWLGMVTIAYVSARGIFARVTRKRARALTELVEALAAQARESIAAARPKLAPPSAPRLRP